MSFQSCWVGGEKGRGDGRRLLTWMFCACSPFTSEIYAKREKERKAGKKTE